MRIPSCGWGRLLTPHQIKKIYLITVIYFKDLTSFYFTFQPNILSMIFCSEKHIEKWLNFWTTVWTK